MCGAMHPHAGWAQRRERERERGRERERRRQRGLVTRRRVKRRWEWSGVEEKERRVTNGVCGDEMPLMRVAEYIYI